MLSKKVSCHSDSSFCDLKWCFIPEQKDFSQCKQASLWVLLTSSDSDGPKKGTEDTGHQDKGQVFESSCLLIVKDNQCTDQ